MKIVFLDANTIGKDIDTKVFGKYAEYTEYLFTNEGDINSRVADADIIITNKCGMNEKTLEKSPVKLICLTATGYDNVDIGYCNDNSIGVCNVKGYSTESVLQHTFTLLLSLWENLFLYHEYTSQREYINNTDFGHLQWTFKELDNKVYGIVGMGRIGKRVAEIADAFGCKVVYWSSSDTDRSKKYTRVKFDEFLKISDIVSIHAPLTDATRKIFNMEAFYKMKENAVIVNVGRGDIIDENDLVFALENKLIAGAALDVLSEEPMTESCAYNKILGKPNFILTPHIAWAAKESRQRCINEICLNIEKFIQGERRNRVDTNTCFII